MPVIMQNTITIHCDVETLYGYVTQPWLWHEWHPNSKSAQASVDVLKQGDSFDEVVALQPLSPLPITLKRKTQYTVLTDTPMQLWEVQGKMKDGWLRIRYEFSPCEQGVEFTRTLTFDASGVSRIMLPLLKPRMAQKSLEALGNLKRTLETQNRGSAETA